MTFLPDSPPQVLLIAAGITTEALGSIHAKNRCLIGIPVRYPFYKPNVSELLAVYFSADMFTLMIRLKFLEALPFKANSFREGHLPQNATCLP
jgi:hypothetical protein